MTRTHKVGTITLGLTLILCGVAFLLQTFWSIFTFSSVCRFWPVIFIILGLEILISNFLDSKGTFVYDKGSIFLCFIVTGFAMVLGFINQILTLAEQQIHISF